MIRATHNMEQTSVSPDFDRFVLWSRGKGEQTWRGERIAKVFMDSVKLRHELPHITYKFFLY